MYKEWPDTFGVVTRTVFVRATNEHVVFEVLTRLVFKQLEAALGFSVAFLCHFNLPGAELRMKFPEGQMLLCPTGNFLLLAWILEEDLASGKCSDTARIRVDLYEMF